MLRRAGDAAGGATPRRSRAGWRGSPARSSPSATSRCTPARRSATRRPRCPRTRTASCCAPARRGCRFARRVPAGVVGVIAPFNVPTILAIRAVAPALALGNAVILKPDPRTAISRRRVFARVFEEAGLPAGVLQVLPGGADVGEALVVEPAVRVIAFTGSTRRRAGGRRAGRPAPQAGAPGARRQLGADRAGRRRRRRGRGSVGAWGTFAHQGQICMATWRHLVHRDIAEEYTAILTEKVEKLPVGDPFRDQVALGPLIDAGQRDRVHGLVTASVDGGRDGAHRRHVRGAVLPADRAGRRAGRRPGLPGGDLRPGRPGHAVLLAGRGRRAGRGHRVRAVARHPHPRRLRRAASWPSGSRPGWCTSTTRPSTTRRSRPFGGVGASGTGSRHGGPRPTSRRSPRPSGSPCAATCPPTPSRPAAAGADRARLNRLTAAGWTVVFVTAADLRHPD